jgi:hypothetical protein
MPPSFSCFPIHASLSGAQDRLDFRGAGLLIGSLIGLLIAASARSGFSKIA